MISIKYMHKDDNTVKPLYNGTLKSGKILNDSQTLQTEASVTCLQYLIKLREWSTFYFEQQS